MSKAVSLVRGLSQHRDAGLFVLIACVATIVTAVDPNFFAWGNLRDLLVRAAPTAIVACGVTLVIATGEIDISVGSLMALLAAFLGTMLSLNEWGWPLWVGVPLVLIGGTLVGLFTGTLVTLGGVPSIIVTLGLLTALRGVTTLVMGGENIDGLPETLMALSKQGVAGLPISIWIAAAVVAITSAIISHTPLGRRIFAIGSNPQSARTIGLSTAKLKLFAFAYTGFLTAVAAVVDVPRLPKIEAGIGVGFELLVVTCVVVGGVSISGGRGRISGVVPAVILITMVRPVLTFLDVGEAAEKWTTAIQGLFILLALVADSLATRRRDGER